MAQSPTIAIPKKSTDEVDWTTPIRTLIAQSYGESPDNYKAECVALQRCRQDAVKGAGSELTARDLLYKYFGQLELLELRFAEIRVTFPWRDAFTAKLTTQTSLAYEKASIIFQIAATHSIIASTQNRSDPEGLKRAFYFFRTAAGMLTYINENFLHAPSTDLSRDVVKFLIDIMIAQAHEVFFEKCRDEKKTPALISKVAAQTASLYAALVEGVKEFQGKKIFDHNWVTLIGIKAKYFTALSQYHRSTADSAAGKHGDALVRLIVAEKAAKEAHTQTTTAFSSYFVTTQSPTLPADAGTALLELTKALLAQCTEARAQGQRDNDLIYNAVLPPEATLPPIEKTVVATPIPIQEVYGAPEVHKTIGADIFIKLIPLSVHESASVYSEEKAKLVRGETEKADIADGECRAALDSLGVKEGLGRYRAMVEGLVASGDVVPREVRTWQDEVRDAEGHEAVEKMLAKLDHIKQSVRDELDFISRDLEIESRDCEAGRLKYELDWTQEPSSGLTKDFRRDLKSHLTALDAASSSDKQAIDMWESVKLDIEVLLDDAKLEDVFTRQAQQAHNRAGSLLDLDDDNGDADWQEREKIGGYVAEIEERLGRLNKLSHERNETLKDLKEKIQADDVSHLLLLSRRNAAEPSIFTSELEKFKPYQTRIQSTVQYQQAAILEIAQFWKSLKDLAGRGAGARKWEEKEKRKVASIKRFSRARDTWMEVREGVTKGLNFYRELSELAARLRRGVKSFVSSRVSEREALVAKVTTERRWASREREASAPPPPRPPPPPSIESSFSSMSLRGPTSPPSNNSWSRPTPPPPPPSQAPAVQSYGSLSSPSQPQRPSYNPPPSAPPPPSNSNPYGDFSAASSISSQFSLDSTPPPPPPPASQSQYLYQTQYSGQAPYNTQQQQQQQPQYGSQQSSRQPLPPPPPSQPGYSSPAPQQHSPYPPPQRQTTSYPPPPPPQHYQQQQQQPQRQSSIGGFPPPPPPLPYQSQQQPSYRGYAAADPYKGYQATTPSKPPQQPQYGQQPQPPAQYGQQPQSPAQYGQQPQSPAQYGQAPDGYHQYGR